MRPTDWACINHRNQAVGSYSVIDMMTVRIRVAQPNDAEGIVRVLNPIIKAGLYTVLDLPVTVEQQRDFIASFPKEGVFHVAERVEDQTIVGLQDVAPFGDGSTHAFDHVGVIASFIDLKLRRKGIGKQLFQATFDTAKKRGFEKLFTYIRADNTDALASYMHHGFRIIGTAQRHARINEEYVDEVLVERFL
jgi:L-amino acid N-acyltransferase YncA